MKLTRSSLLALATVSLALASCSSEPSDWRPDEKVSTDLVEPGTRETENFDHALPSGSVENQDSPVAQAAAAAAKGAEAAPTPSAESAITANGEEGLRKRGQLNDAGKSGQADTAANGHQIQR